LRTGGLEPLEPFEGLKAWRLTRCLRCGCQAHYRLEYVLDGNEAGLDSCRACHWRSWAASGRVLQGAYARRDVITEAAARAHAEEHGHDYLGALTDPSLHNDPHRYRCRSCGRISAARMSDIAFGCACLTHAKRSVVTSRTPGSRTRELLKDSDSPARQWWDHEQNPEQEWASVTVRARRLAHWRCPQCSTRFSASVQEMTQDSANGPRCPTCAARRAAEREAQMAELRDKTIAEVPELLAAWDDEADPRIVTVLGRHTLSGLHRFHCPNGHHPRSSPYRYLSAGCPHCQGDRTRAANLDAAVLDPAAFAMNPEIGAQWHPTRNTPVRAEKVSPGSRRTFWWREPSCGHEWQDTPGARDSGTRLRCPICRTILDSLAYHYPDIAAEWAPVNPVTAWHVRPSAQTRFLPQWVCATDPAHVWQAPLSSRVNGAGCPQCREHGKSAVELEHFSVAQRLFEQARSGESVRSQAFTRRSQWTVDITACLASGQRVAIEYDGAYWHADKVQVDTEKSIDLLAAGYLVARLREHPLPPLPLEHESYREFLVYSQAPDPEDVITRVRYWAGATSRR